MGLRLWLGCWLSRKHYHRHQCSGAVTDYTCVCVCVCVWNNNQIGCTSQDYTFCIPGLCSQPQSWDMTGGGGDSPKTENQQKTTVKPAIINAAEPKTGHNATSFNCNNSAILHVTGHTYVRSVISQTQHQESETDHKRHAIKCRPERICGADQNNDNLWINRTHMRISDYCNIRIRV